MQIPARRRAFWLRVFAASKISATFDHVRAVGARIGRIPGQENFSQRHMMFAVIWMRAAAKEID